MQYKVTNIDKEYDCGDIGITTDMWYELLKEPKAAQYMDALVTFLREPQHKSSCYLVGKKYDEDPQHFNAKITNFGKWVNSQLNDFSMIGADGKQTYWAIPMRYGWETKDGFVWQLREELVEALQKCLLEGLIDEFRDGNGCPVSDETYKWKLLQECDGKSNVEIAKKLRSQNIVDNPRVDSVLKYLWDNKQDSFNVCLGYLLNESESLNARVAKYKETMRGLCPQEWNNSANDERTAAAFLTCRFPYKYTFYKEEVYSVICGYLGIEKRKSAGLKYEHFMQIINAITKKYGGEIQNIVSKDIEPFSIKPTILAVQTLFWCLKDEMDKKLKMINVEEMETVMKKELDTQLYIDLLKANRNIILNGAPGTGKTYLAKKIAEEMGAKVKMVQFHPSYDYTDFVEGLRPMKDGKGNVGFEHKDGVFKEFCKKALNVNSVVQQSVIGNLPDYLAVLQKCATKAFPPYYDTVILPVLKKYNSFFAIRKGELVYEKNIGNSVKPAKKKVSVLHVRKEILMRFILKCSLESDDQMYKEIVEVLDNLNNFLSKNKFFHKNKTPFVFIIDEINRGEISKIFGELFFSIDPGYRGEKGKVQTQYQNLVEDGDVFKDGFFVPENVYIIGTMNDIDRSVESMDFAMRRRFAWHEVTAEESAMNMGLNEELTMRMIRLNEVIGNTEGLGSAYHVGGSFFLKVQNGEMTVESLWNLNLKSLMKEYLRGLPDADEVLDSMENAYFLKD